MARDWVKMRTDLYRDPKVSALADALFDLDADLARFVSQNTQHQMCVTRNVTRNTVIGALVSVWGVMRHRGKRDGDDLMLKGMSIDVIDDVCDIPGFGRAMAVIGWVIKKKEGIVFPNFFEENNVEPETANRSKAAERQARYRQKKASQGDDSLRATSDVTSDVTLRSREEREKEHIQEQELPPLSPKQPELIADDPPAPARVGKCIVPPAKHRGEPERFPEFYALYPRKVARPKAAQAFAKLTEADQLAAIAAVPLFARSWDWRKEGGQFVPHPTTWLNQRRWEDRPPPEHAPIPDRQPVRQSRQAAIFEALANDQRYADTADRHALALGSDPQGLPPIDGTFAVLPAGSGRDRGHG